LGERLGVPVIVLLFAGWYIRYLQDSFKEERQAMQSREEREERELIQIVKTTSAALLEVKTALLEQTAAIKLLIEKLK